MPNNSDRHMDRIRKVKEGFTAANLPTDRTQTIIAIFDALEESRAKEVSDRSVFSVSTGSKMTESLFGKGSGEARRQMSRAILFLQDLQALYTSGTLPSRTTDVLFEGMWRSDDTVLRSQLQGLAGALCDFDTGYREVLGAKVPVRPKPVVRKLVVPQATLSLLRDVQKSQRLRIAAVRHGETSVGAAKTAWSNAKLRLVADFTTQLGKSLANIDSIQIAATNAYTEFKTFFADAGKETEAKIGLAKSFFSALESYAPFPVSIVGKIGGAAVGMLHVDSSVQQTRALGEQVYFNSDIPTLAKASSKLAAVKNWGTDLTRLGVSGTSVSSSASIKDTIDSAKRATLESLMAIFKQAIDETYGDNPTQMDEKSMEFYLRVAASLPGARPELVTTMTLHKITHVSDLTRQAILGMGELRLVDSRTLQPFIELQLFAEYLAQLAPTDSLNFDVTIPDALIRRLEGRPFELVVRKSGRGQSQKIYAGGKLAWEGHIRHKGALIVFFRWYAKNVNAFDIAVGRTTAAGVEQAMARTIQLIGTEVETHAVRRRFRTTDTADWGKVSQAVVR